MAIASHHVKRSQTVHESPDETRQEVSQVDYVSDPEAETTGRQNVATQVVWYITGVLLSLLALRFVLALLGANPANAFANFIYSITYPFVAPFFSLFNYRLQYGISRFELFTLVAMLVYALIAYGVVRLININRHSTTSAHTY